MTKKLKISPDLSLPIDAATSTIVVYGGKGMGKTNLASVLVEEFAGAGIRFAVIDPMGVWWGLRHGADGKGLGIPVLILGGIHGDLPITPESGPLVADLVVDEDASVIIDISRRADGSMWAIAERVRFVTAYAKRLYQRQGEKRRPLNVVIDEAARFAPQIVRQGELEVAACMGAIAVLVEEGRNVGVGIVLVTQRSARLNKDVAELADCMIAFRIVGPNSMRAVLDWLGEHVEKARLKDLSEKLRSLPRGSALVISPGWLEFEGVVAMRKRTTFDSSKTPEAGKEVRASGPGAKPDLAAYRERLAVLVEQQKANDPKTLKARVAELEKQLAAKPGAKLETKVVEHAVLKDGQLARAEAAIAAVDKLITRWDDINANAHAASEEQGKRLTEAFHRVASEIAPVRDAITKAKSPPVGVARVPRPTTPRPAPAPVVLPDGEKLSTSKQRILDALASLEVIGVAEADKTQLALFAEQSPTSSGYTNNLGALRTLGLIDYPGPGTAKLTDAGRAIADSSGAPTTTEEMHAYVRELLGGPRWKVLAPLIDAYPKAIAKDVLAEAAGVSATSSGYTNNLGAMRSLGLLDYPRPGEVRAADLLFLA